MKGAKQCATHPAVLLGPYTNLARRLCDTVVGIDESVSVGRDLCALLGVQSTTVRRQCERVHCGNVLIHILFFATRNAVLLSLNTGGQLRSCAVEQFVQ